MNPEEKQYGLVFEPEKPEDYHFGGVSKLSGIPLTDGHWLPWAPTDELQLKNGVETSNCTAFGTANCLEVLMKRVFDIVENFSDRFIGIIANTVPPGNDPNIVIQAVRKSGLIPEADLPFDDSIKTWQDYFKPKPPTNDLVQKGLAFLAKYKIGHEWVDGYTDPATLKEALKFSPLGVGVAAWYIDSNGLYYVPEGANYNHWVALVDFKEGEYWVIIDSYLYDGSFYKKLRWNYQFMKAKRYSLEINNDSKISLIQRIISLIYQVIGLLQKKNEVVPPVPLVVEPAPTSKIKEWAEAIKVEEGWYDGSRSWRNNSPGNIKYSALVKELGASGVDKDGFAIFPSYPTGFEAICSFLRLACEDKLKPYHSARTLVEFTRVYANPPTNHPYAENIARKLKVAVDVKISTLL